MVLTRIFLQIHDSRRLLISYWFNDFLRGNLVSLYSLVFKLFLHSQGHWGNKRIVNPECTNYIRGPGEYFPGKMFWKLDSRKRHILHSLNRTQLINTGILLSFSQSRYSWSPSRSTKIHDSQVFKTKINDSYMFCKYDSWFMIPLPPPKIIAVFPKGSTGYQSILYEFSFQPKSKW